MADGFEGLEVWQKAHVLMLFVHQRVAPCLPSDEKWDLASQIRRSSKSIGANIAEGHGRFYYQDNVRFCYNARGSLAETIQHLIVARDLNYITEALYNEGHAQAEQVYRLLNGYIAYLKQRKIGEHEPGAKLIIHETRVAYEVGDWVEEPDAFTDSPIDQLPITDRPVTDY